MDVGLSDYRFSAQQEYQWKVQKTKQSCTQKTKKQKQIKTIKSKKNPVAVEKEEERERKSRSVLLSFTKSPEEPGLAGCEAVLQNTIHKEKVFKKIKQKKEQKTKTKQKTKNIWRRQKPKGKVR